jgi:hypothetical protein
MKKGGEYDESHFGFVGYGSVGGMFQLEWIKTTDLLNQFCPFRKKKHF